MEANLGLKLTDVEDLSVSLKQSGEQYLPKMIFLLVCGINRHLGNVQGEMAFNKLEKSIRR